MDVFFTLWRRQHLRMTECRRKLQGLSPLERNPLVLLRRVLLPPLLQHLLKSLRAALLLEPFKLVDQHELLLVGCKESTMGWRAGGFSGRRTSTEGKARQDTHIS